MTTQINITTVTIQSQSASQVVRAGASVSDAGVQAAILAAGGQLGSATDATLLAAQARVVTMRGRGANEAEIDKVMMAAFTQSAKNLAPQEVTIDVPLATIQAQTSGVAFNIGAVLPANARLEGIELDVLTTLSGGSAASAHATVQGGSDAAGSLIGSTDVFTATGSFDTPGSDPYPDRGGQQLKMTITGDGTHALSALTAGHLSVVVVYSVTP